MNPTLLSTKDGSHTLHSTRFDASYHSSHGAIQEAETVFINAGLLHQASLFPTQPLSILEIGFGTGLNTLMSMINAKEHGLKLRYLGMEAYPISVELASSLNYASCLEAEDFQDSFLELHQTNNQWKTIWEDDYSSFEFMLKVDQFENIEYFNEFDIVYFDAFAPSVQPTLWQEPVLAKMFRALKPNGLLLTYCAQGAFKRALKAVGFAVEPLPGPIGKREMTRALKSG